MDIGGVSVAWWTLTCGVSEVRSTLLAWLPVFSDWLALDRAKVCGMLGSFCCSGSAGFHLLHAVVYSFLVEQASFDAFIRLVAHGLHAFWYGPLDSSMQLISGTLSPAWHRDEYG